MLLHLTDRWRQLACIMYANEVGWAALYANVVWVQTKTINIMYAVREDVQGLLRAIDDVCKKAAQAARDQYQLIVLSDKLAGKRLVPIRWLPVVTAARSVPKSFQIYWILCDRDASNLFIKQFFRVVFNVIVSCFTDLFLVWFTSSSCQSWISVQTGYTNCTKIYRKLNFMIRIISKPTVPLYSDSRELNV